MSATVLDFRAARIRLRPMVLLAELDSVISELEFEAHCLKGRFLHQAERDFFPFRADRTHRDLTEVRRALHRFHERRIRLLEEIAGAREAERG